MSRADEQLRHWVFETCNRGTAHVGPFADFRNTAIIHHVRGGWGGVISDYGRRRPSLARRHNAESSRWVPPRGHIAQLALQPLSSEKAKRRLDGGAVSLDEPGSLVEAR